MLMLIKEIFGFNGKYRCKLRKHLVLIVILVLDGKIYKLDCEYWFKINIWYCMYGDYWC